MEEPPDEPIDPPLLDERKQQFVRFLASGLSARQAALKVGFSQSYSRKASRLLKHPAIARELNLVQMEARTSIAYTVAVAMAEAAETMRFARQTENANAYCKAVELRAKLSGLLIDKVEVVTVDLTGALQAAQSRVLKQIRES